jgi:predicted ATPase
MKITSFSFTDLKTSWTLEETSFDAFNLLVGVSGAGKTKIVEALKRVCAATLRSGAAPADCVWALAFEHKNVAYRWEAQTGTSDAESPGAGKSPLPSFLMERVTVDQKPLIDRTEEHFSYGEKLLPKLKSSETAILLLEEEPSLLAIRAAFRSVMFSEAVRPEEAELSDDQIYGPRGQPAKNLDLLRSALAVGNSALYGGLVTYSGYVLQETLPDDWQNLQSTYRAIFPGVTKIGVDRVRLPEGRSKFVLRIREEGYDGWIPQERISSGMVRTLAHLIEMTVAPPGSVIVIDEFENSLGINCMPPLVDFLLERAPDFQYILTSHHPYIINNLPTDTWKLVMRKGSVVRVVSARDIPALRGASHHQAFTRLINLPEYVQDVS